MESEIEEYYRKRAEEYDRVYEKPERQDDLKKLEAYLGSEFRNLNVLEVACGTGYWTRFIAKSARSIYAVDSGSEVLRLAKKRDYGDCSVRFGEADAYTLDGIDNTFSGGFCGFWWSHVPVNRRDEFLVSFHSHLVEGSRVIMIDNRYVEGSSTPINREDGGNTYQLRKLDDGTVYEVLKIFPSGDELKNSFSRYTDDLKVTLLDYYWMTDYRIK